MMVDTHTHIVAQDQSRYPRNPTDHPGWIDWLKDMPVSAEKLTGLMAGAGVDRAVLVQAVGVYAYDSSYVTDTLARNARRFAAASPFAAVCSVDLDGGEESAGKLESWVERGATGVRFFTLTKPESFALDGPATAPLWRKARDLKVPVCVAMHFHQIESLRRALRRFPEVPVVLDGMASPNVQEGYPYPGMAPLLALADVPSVHLKFMTPTLYGAGRGKGTVRDLFKLLLDRFGPRRMMWGSNFPNTYDRPYADLVAYAREILSFLPEEDRRWLFGETALSLWPTLR